MYDLNVTLEELILHHLPDPLILTDTNNNILWLNSRAEHVFQLISSDIKGMALNEVLPVYRISTLVEEVLKTGKPANTTYEESTIKIDGHAQEYFFKIAVVPVFQENGITGTLTVLTDVTRFYELERMKTDFVSIVSHEFRTPLASITIAVGMLKEGILGELNNKGQKIIDAVEEDCDRLNRLISHLLDLSRVKEGHIPMEMEKVDVYGLVREGVSPLMLQAHHKGVEIVIDLLPELPTVEADFNKAVWLLTNLIGNALRYTERGGRITISARLKENRIFFAVTDTGCGIPRDYRKKIFQKHVQVKGDTRTGGIGLGLAICQEVVEAHGGQIWVESTEGVGSTFTFTLPLATREAKIPDK